MSCDGHDHIRYTVASDGHDSESGMDDQRSAVSRVVNRRSGGEGIVEEMSRT